MGRPAGGQRRGGARAGRRRARRRVREGNRLLDRGRSELAAARLLRRPARPDRRGHRAGGRGVPGAHADGCVIRLEQSRDVGALLRDSFTVYLRHFGTFLALGALVVVPSQVIVGGIGMEQLTADYDATAGWAETSIAAAVAYLVVAPLITAICVHALHSVAGGGSPGAREAIVRGFESFAPIFFAVLLAALGIALGLLVIVPGIYLFVRWYFVPQTVVLEGARDTGALRASGRLVEGAWWRTFGMVLLVNLIALVAAVLLGYPFAAAAEGTDRAIWSLAGQIVAAVVTQPFAALFATLLYFDLRERKRSAHAG